MAQVLGECYFLDVGLGSAQVIDLSDDSAIVIDCGPSFPVLGDLLKRRLGKRRIAAVILSHNHADHIGGLSGLIANYRKAIDRIYLLQDRNAVDLVAQRSVAFMRDEVSKGHIPKPHLLVRQPNNVYLWPCEPPQPLTLELLFPDVFENLDGQASGDPNASSAVLLLSCANGRILFGGDSNMAAWRSIHRSRNRPINCDVLAVPHHGGHLTDSLHEADDLKWLYNEAINAKTAIVSAGTVKAESGQPPNRLHLQALHSSGACVVCTQITKHCSSAIETLRPAVLDRIPPRTIGLASQGAVACAGTVLVEISDAGISIVRNDEHQAAINSKLVTAAGHHPCCRPAVS